jgi:hypothetical protein
MNVRYEYKFVRLGEGILGARRAAEQDYQKSVHEHASEGWRLVQVFAPSTGVDGWAKYYELILERPVQNPVDSEK